MDFYNTADAAFLGIALALADVLVGSSRSCLWSLINSHTGPERPYGIGRAKWMDRQL